MPGRRLGNGERGGRGERKWPFCCATKGPLGAKIEFFSNVSQSIKERNVLLVDLEPLPDELLPDDIRGDSNGSGDADTTPAAEQARRPHESNTRALSAV